MNLKKYIKIGRIFIKNKLAVDCTYFLHYSSYFCDSINSS